jgi:hypothetical protein
MPTVIETFTFNGADWVLNSQSVDLTPPHTSSNASILSTWFPLFQDGQPCKKGFRLIYNNNIITIGKEKITDTTVTLALGKSTYAIGAVHFQNTGRGLYPANTTYTMTNCQVGGRYSGKNVTMTVVIDDTPIRTLVVTST